MGGDGGVIASNRRYMRGAGTADHTGDSSTNNNGKLDPAVEREELRRTMTTCAVSGQPLQFGKETIVTCPYGRLYHKEAAIEALLHRKQQDTDTLGAHIRGLKDLKEVRFHLITSSDGESIPACPIRGTELNGQIPAIALLPGGSINVVSERALKEMGDDILQEYGPSKKTIRLAPTAFQLKEMQKEQPPATEKGKRNGHEKKRKHKEDNEGTTSSSTLGDQIRATVAFKVQKSQALSSLFTSADKTQA